MVGGVSDYLKKKIHEKVTNYKAEREYGKEQKLERREQYNKGYNEGQYKRGVTEGSGGVTAQEKYQNRGNRGGRVQRTTGNTGFSGSMNKFDSIFGASSYGGSRGNSGGIGMGLGFGGNEGKTRPDRVITKANGRVKIEEYSRREPSGGMGLGDGIGMGGGGLGLDGFGAPATGKGKREKHPYEF